MRNNLAVDTLLSLTTAPRDLIESIREVSVNSRDIKPGDLFFALPGAKVDGHEFLAEAAANGAIAAVVNESYPLDDNTIPMIKVKSPLDLLQQWSQAVIAETAATIVAITGSVGKTTTKHFLAHLLQEKFRISLSPGNSNSKIGLPLSILNHTSGDEQILVFEMGMTEAGQIARLVEIAPPHIAVITSVAWVHGCNFHGLEDIAHAKAEILSQPRTQVGIVHRGIANFEELAKRSAYPLMTFDLADQKADFTLSEMDNEITLLLHGKVLFNQKRPPIHGKHNIHNYLAAALVANRLGMEWDEIAIRSQSLTMPDRRWQTIEKQGALIINDAYNASPISMRAALDAIPLPMQGGKRIAVLGAMAELGDMTENFHREIACYAIDRCEYLLCFGQECECMPNEWQSLGKPAWIFSNLDELAIKLQALIQPGDVVLIKGSRSIGMEVLLDKF